jgi:hypothetical protein
MSVGRAGDKRLFKCFSSYAGAFCAMAMSPVKLLANETCHDKVVENLS